MPRYALEEEIFKGILKISLPGVTKLFEVDCSIEAKPTGLIHLKVARSFLFSDFNLVAPSRVLGAVKVKDKLNVKFHLILKLDPDP